MLIVKAQSDFSVGKQQCFKKIGFMLFDKHTGQKLNFWPNPESLNRNFRKLRRISVEENEPQLMGGFKN